MLLVYLHTMSLPIRASYCTYLIQIQGARRVLEIGTLGGYSTIWLARALPTDGYLVTLEANPHHAEVARSNLARANLLYPVDLRVGNALNLLPGLQPPSILFLLMPISPTIPIIWTGHSSFLGQEQ